MTDDQLGRILKGVVVDNRDAIALGCLQEVILNFTDGVEMFQIALRRSPSRLLGPRTETTLHVFFVQHRHDQENDIGLIVVLSRSLEGMMVEPLPPSAVLVRIAGQALRSATDERVMFQRLAALVRRIPAIYVVHDRIEPAIEAIESEVERILGPTPTRRHLPSRSTP